jgi:hypothetical protein
MSDAHAQDWDQAASARRSDLRREQVDSNRRFLHVRRDKAGTPGTHPNLGEGTSGCLSMVTMNEAIEKQLSFFNRGGEFHGQVPFDAWEGELMERLNREDDILERLLLERGEIMNIGPKMAFVLQVYLMTDDEAAVEQRHELEMAETGLMSWREFSKRSATRHVARKIRQRDNTSNWPRDVNTRPYRYRRLRDGKVGHWGEVTKDSRDGDSFVRVGDEALLHQDQTKH